MNTYIHKKFNEQILQLSNFDNALIAISGGQDSLCLIKLIEDLQKKSTEYIRLEYIYIDHKWRKDSKYNIEHLINYIRKTSSKICIYETKCHKNSEVEARKFRYQVIIQHAINNQYSNIITGHTNTDKIETFFQQLIRGTSLDGATSLTFRRQIGSNLELIRPLINIKRLDINWFCRKFYLPIWSDITNYQYNLARNRLRYELLPYLNQYFILNAEDNINKFINIAERENEYIKQNALKLYLLSRHNINIALNCTLINKQHKALQMRTLEIFFYHHFNKPLNYDTLLKIINLIHSRSRTYKQIRWNKLKINIYNDWIYIT